MKTKNTIHKAAMSVILPVLLAFGSAERTKAQSVARIAFQANVAAGQRTSYSQIFSMNPDGTGLIQLTSANASAFAPRWSPGQQYIAFYRGQTLYVMESRGEANGGRSFAVAPVGAYGSDWSPDGSNLVFRGTNGGLYLVAVNAQAGTAGTPVRFRPGYYYDPSWSPDGTRIAFWGDDDGSTNELIHIRNVTTGAEISFGAAPYHNYVPQWSPDGTQIAFTGPVTVTTKTRKGTVPTTYQEIFLAQADGTGITQVTYWSSDTYYATWSPDGTTLAFNVNGGLYKMLLGSNAATLLFSGGNNPDWNP